MSKYAFDRLVFGVCALLVGLALAGCGAQQKLDDMHDATNDMRTQTGKLGETSEAIRRETADTHSDLAQKGTDDVHARTRPLLLELLRPAAKLSVAAKYHMSFEYQLWSPTVPGGEEKRLELAADAAREFYREIQELLPVGLNVWPNPLATADSSFSDKVDGNRALSLNALAGTMQEVNAKQKALRARDPSLRELSMLSLTQDALRASFEIRAGRRQAKDYPRYVAEIREFEQVAVYLLQARHNFAAAIALGIVSDIEASGASGLIGMVCRGRWRPLLERLNDQQLLQAAKYLRGGRETREFLRSVGIEPVVDATLRSVYVHMDFLPFLNSTDLSPTIKQWAESFTKEASSFTEETTTTVGGGAPMRVLRFFCRK